MPVFTTPGVTKPVPMESASRGDQFLREQPNNIRSQRFSAVIPGGLPTVSNNEQTVGRVLRPGPTADRTGLASFDAGRLNGADADIEVFAERPAASKRAADELSVFRY
jgi:hypothetical protein